MLRLRFCASILSVLSLGVAAWAWVGGEGGAELPAAVLVAAACLAAASPFDAPDPRRRTRVAAACLGYVAALAAALLIAHAAAASGLIVTALFLLAELGLGLAGWALATRNRRRMAASRRYYDN